MRKSLNIIMALVLMTLSVASYAADAESSSSSSQQVVNINTADISQLALLPRVGEKAAQRIVDYRKEHGPFRKATDLMQVKGIGAKTFERMAPYIALEGKTTLTTKVRSPRTKPASKPATTAS